MKRTASAVWNGAIMDGKGTISTQSGVLKDAQYSFATRFENGIGTNPEELLGAAHAGCFSMALSGVFGSQNITPEKISTTATVSIEKEGEGFSITTVHLDVSVKASGLDQAKFEELAAIAKETCPLSKVLKAKITMTAKLGA
ncbi:MAG: OsmC family protein [Rhizobacter sp.]|nr:OsmC family protein [Chlorobiales bacterium]